MSESDNENQNNSNSSPKKIVLLAGESSGDILGAGLMRALKEKYPLCEFEGIGGPLMIKEGFSSLYPMERLSVMGLVDPLLRLPELLSILSKLKNKYIETPPDIFVGIDAPDFNLRLEKALKKVGIFTTHYVSPSVWAWRQGRIKTIKKSVDLMLTVFPFEADFYREHNVDVSFVGHPLADDIPLVCDTLNAKNKLGLDYSADYVALMPGSRKSEVQKILPIMHETAFLIQKKMPNIKFLLPAANDARAYEIQEYLKASADKLSGPKITVIDQQSHNVMASSKLVVMASGTTTLEAMLLKKPMVVCYKMSALSFAIISRLAKIPYVSLPNLLSKSFLVPEFLQGNAVPKDIADKALEFLDDENKEKDLQSAFLDMHLSLKKNASEQACDAIIKFWRKSIG